MKLLVAVLVCGWTLLSAGAGNAWSTATEVRSGGRWERNEPSAKAENEPGAHAYNRSLRAAFSPKQLADALAKRFVCPLTFLTQNYQQQLLNCSQTRYREWLLNCQQEDELDGVSASNQSVRLIARTAQLGLKCRHPVTCHWPVCQQYQIPRLFFMQEQSAEKARLFFQENVVNNVNYVIGSHHSAICHQYTDASEIWKELQQKYEILPGHEMMNNMALILGLHLTQSRCIRSTSSQSEELIPATSEFAQLNADNMSLLYDAYLSEMFQYYSNNASEIDETGLSNLLHDVGLYVDNDSNVPTTTPSVSRRSIRAIAAETSPFATAYKLHRRSRRSTDPSSPNLSKCYDSLQLIAIFDTDNSGSLNSSDFLQLFSYIVYQISHGNRCEISEEKNNDYNRAEVYGYGTLAVFVISACSALGFIIIPMLPESVYEIMMTAFIALAFGTLTGDALLHMLPECLVDVDEGDPAEDQAFYKTLVITFSIYLLFLFEGFTHLLVKNTHEHEHSAHGHSHTHDHQFVQQHAHKVTRLELEEKVSGLEIIAVPSTEALTPGDQEKNKEGAEDVASTSSVNLQEMILSEDQNPVFLGLTSLALVIIIGDAIHNVTDGISIGASFASDLKTGFSTSLAVLFHELPHEFGDFVILLTTGLSLKRALLWNFISSLSAFVGLYVGIAVGENEEADRWIFAVTSGMFLYVAIADMLPEMKNIKSRRPWIAFLAQNIGALFGIGFMIFMHYLEDLIHF